MDITRKTIQANRHRIPCIIIEPKESFNTAILIHGYGGCKEELLGLGLRVAECGFTSCLIDLPGHGENLDNFTGDVRGYVNAVIEYYRGSRKIVAIGHSLGGRIALASNAKYVIGISPSLPKEFSAPTREFIKNIRGYRVREQNPDFLWDLHRELPSFDIAAPKKALLLFGSRDVPEIISECKTIQISTNYVLEIYNALHSDIYVNEKVNNIIVRKLKEWKKPMFRPFTVKA